MPRAFLPAAVLSCPPSLRHRLPVLALAVLAMLAVSLPAAPPAAAHGGATTVPVLQDVSPALPAGVELSVASTAVAALLDLAVTGDQTVTVADPAGVPWLRVGPQGVEVDAGVAETYRTTSPEGGAVPAEVSSGARDRRWTRVSTTPRWAWFEHRLHPGGGQAAGEWEVPLSVGSTLHRARGTVEQLPPVTGQVTGALRSSAPDGVAVDVLPGNVPGLLLRLDGAQDVLVRGTAGEPYLRFTPVGVSVNVRSDTYRNAELARGSTAVDAVAPAGDGVDWQPVSGTPAYAWTEPRARAPLDLPEEVRTSDRVRDLLTWEVPLEVDGQEVVLAGVTRWTPGAGVPRSEGEEGTPWPVLAGAGAAMALAVAVAFRRRRAGTV